MECLEAKALKSSFHWELAMKSPSQPEASEEIWCANVISGEDFKVEEFFNFPNGDSEHGSSSLQIEEEEGKGKGKGKDGLFSNKTGESLFIDDSDSYLSVGLSIPNDALADLEWVSQFVDDSCLDFSFSCPAVKSDTFRSQPETRTEISCFPLAFPVRPRSKRSRQSKTAKSSPNQSPSSSSSSASSGISSTPCFIFTDSGENDDSFNGPNEPPKKQRKTTGHQGGSVSTVQFQRRCSHCLVQKTPQWRTGPNGAKTLCNACGVRYKSGRLFPEYRPALSPTFCSDIHSNSHRKVLEIRKVKEIGEPVSGLTRMVQSY